VKAPRPTPALAAGFLALILVAACESAPARHPNSTQTIVLTPKDASPVVEMDIATAIQIVLPGPDAGSGYAWEIASNNSKILEQMGPLKAAAGPGGGTTTGASFYSLRPGRSVVRFFLVRLGEQVAVPAGSYEITVRVTD
jgi:predicted secreted protein